MRESVRESVRESESEGERQTKTLACTAMQATNNSFDGKTCRACTRHRLRESAASPRSAPSCRLCPPSCTASLARRRSVRGPSTPRRGGHEWGCYVSDDTQRLGVGRHKRTGTKVRSAIWAANDFSRKTEERMGKDTGTVYPRNTSEGEGACGAPKLLRVPCEQEQRVVLAIGRD